MSKALTRDEVEAKAKAKVEYVDLTDVGKDGGVYVRELFPLDLVAIFAKTEETVQALAGDEESRTVVSFSNFASMAPAIALALCDEDGTEWYGLQNLDRGIEVVRTWPKKAQIKASETVTRISSLDMDQTERAESLKETPGD